jgi:hypothetical protein
LFNVIVGIALLCLILYYFYLIKVPINTVLSVILSISTVSLLILAVSKINSISKTSAFWGKNFYVFIASGIYFIGILLTQYFIVYGVSDRPTGYLGNNDLFSWSFMSDCFLERSNAKNVIPSGALYFERIKFNCIGTYFMLALFSKVADKSSLEVITCLVLTFLALQGLILTQLIKYIYKTSDLVSVSMATITLSNSFYFYVAQNYFLSQVAATTIFLAAILFLLKYQRAIHYIKYTSVFVVILSAIVLLYQASVVVFYALLCLIMFFEAIGQRRTRDALYRSSKLLFSFFLRIAVLLPYFCFDLLEILHHVSNVIVQWELPFISLDYLLSLPTFNIFPKSTWLNTSPAVVSIVAFGCLMYTSYILFNDKRNCLKMRMLSVFSLSLLVYAIYFQVKPMSYQAWKFASYAILPLSFIPLTATLSFFAKISKRILINKFAEKALFLFSTMYLFFISNKYNAKSFYNYETLQRIKKLENKLSEEKIKNVLLQTPPFGPTMILIPFFAKNFKIFPLSASYFEKATIADYINVAEDSTKVISIDSNSYENSNMKDLYFVDSQFSKNKAEFIYCFNTGAINLFSGIELKSTGLGVAEHWGAWSNGSEVNFRIQIPSTKTESFKSILFDLMPFKTQNFDVYINDKFYNSFYMEKKGQIKITLHHMPQKNAYIRIVFKIKNAQCPAMLDSRSSETRTLGLGFIRLELSAK